MTEVTDEHRLAAPAATEDANRFGVRKDAYAIKERRNDELIRHVGGQLLGAVLEKGFSKN
jgi:hypothetical protein